MFERTKLELDPIEFVFQKWNPQCLLWTSDCGVCSEEPEVVMDAAT